MSSIEAAKVDYPVPAQPQRLTSDYFAHWALRRNMKKLLFAMILAVCSLRAQDPGLWQGYDGEWDHVTHQLIALADAMPADKYTWRPAPGVRSSARSTCISRWRTSIC